MRKDAKIALIVILSLMVLVVVIWGRSPRPDDTLATPKASPQDTTAADPEVIAAAKSDASDTDAARHDAPGAAPADHSSSFPADTAMMNHLQPADTARMRHVPDSPTGDSVAPGPADAQPGGAPADGAGTPTPAPRPVVTHTVVKGDNLIKLAIKYYKDQSKWRLIQQANRGVSVLQIGQKLIIPPLPDAPAKAAEGSSPATRPTTGGSPPPATPSPSRPATPAPTPSRAKTYTVQKGDTFMKIARSVYRDPGKWRTLYERNRGKLPDPSKPASLRAGTVLEVPALASSQ